MFAQDQLCGYSSPIQSNRATGRSPLRSDFIFAPYALFAVNSSDSEFGRDESRPYLVPYVPFVVIS